MFSKIRSAFGLAVLLALTTILTVFAKGEFSFIAITGPDLEAEIRSTDTDLTADFFAFADFYQDQVDAPSDPGRGYEITRYYVDGSREIAFDRLHYYPESGFVFYDGILNGDSEYDGEWYSANPAIKTIFESTLAALPVVKSAPAEPVKELQSSAKVQETPATPSILQVPVPGLAAILAGAAVLLFAAMRLRKRLG